MLQKSNNFDSIAVKPEKKEAQICKRNSLTFWEAEYQTARKYLELSVERSKESYVIVSIKALQFPLLSAAWMRRY